MSVTIKDIAKKANVSITTVSRIINNKYENASEETRQRVLQIMEECGYRPNRIARGLVTKKTHILGLILPDITNPFFPDIARGVEDAANNWGYNIILCNTDNNTEKEKTYIEILNEKCVDGIIYTGSIPIKEENIENLLKYNTPFVLLDRYTNAPNLPFVCTDGEKGIYKIVKYLIENGHSSIAYISGAEGDLTANNRFRGYAKALNEYGIRMDLDIVKHGDYKLNSGKKCMEELINSNKKFTAVVCENDLMAVGALEVLNNLKIKVPDEISVTGYDNTYISNVTFPKLTTVSQPTYEMGHAATELLIKLINKEEVTEKVIILEPEVVIRNSVKRRRN